MEDNKIWQEYEKNKSPEMKEAIINKYAQLVKIVAGKLHMYTNNLIDYDDLVSYGIFGLLDAIEKFDYTKGFKFETYASLRIRGEIIDNIRKLDWIPRSLRNKNKLLLNTISDFESSNGRSPTEQELAQILNLSVAEVGILIKNSSVYNLISLDDYLDKNHEFVNNFADNDDMPEKSIIKDESKKTLVKLISNLTEKQQLVITLYYYEELTLKEISKVMKVSESRVSQIHSRAIQILKDKIQKDNILINIF